MLLEAICAQCSLDLFLYSSAAENNHFMSSSFALYTREFVNVAQLSSALDSFLTQTVEAEALAPCIPDSGAPSASHNHT